MALYGKTVCAKTDKKATIQKVAEAHGIPLRKLSARGKYIDRTKDELCADLAKKGAVVEKGAEEAGALATRQALTVWRVRKMNKTELCRHLSKDEMAVATGVTGHALLVARSKSKKALCGELTKERMVAALEEKLLRGT